MLEMWMRRRERIHDDWRPRKGGGGVVVRTGYIG